MLKWLTDYVWDNGTNLIIYFIDTFAVNDIKFMKSDQMIMKQLFKLFLDFVL